MAFTSEQTVQAVRTARYVYPTLADGVTLQTADGDWELGGMTVVVPPDTIDKDFRIKAIVIEQCNRPNKTHEIVLYAGEKEVEISRRRFVVDSSSQGVVPVDIDTHQIPADTCIKARLAVQGSGEKIATISLQYEG